MGESNANTNPFTDSLQTKLSGIEAGATADQSASEIKTAHESNSDTNALTDALLSKVNGIEASADVTDVINAAAGALMTTGGTLSGSLTASGVAATGLVSGSNIKATRGVVQMVSVQHDSRYKKLNSFWRG